MADSNNNSKKPNFTIRKEYIGEEVRRIDVYKYGEFKKWNIIKTEDGEETVLKILYGSSQLANLCVLFFSKGDYTTRDWDYLITHNKRLKDIKRKINKID